MSERKLIQAAKRSDVKTVQDILFNSPPKNPNQKLTPNLKLSTEDLQRRNQIIQINHVDVNCRDSKFQMTPLMIASLQGCKDIAIYLIYHNANMNLRDSRGNTALQLACMKQRFHIISILIKHGANVNDVNASGWNCLISAVNYFHEETSILLLFLLQSGAKSEQKDNNGLMVIDHAVRKHKTNAIRVILNYNMKLVSQCSRALVNASIKGYLDIVLLLLNFGVNPNKIDIITGTGPQHEAVRFSSLKDEKIRDIRLRIIEYLSMYGADPNLPNTSGETPMRLASQKPQHLVQSYINALRTSQNVLRRVPRFINPNAKSLSDLIYIPKYPLLRPRINWTRNDFRFCTQPKIPTTSNPILNLIDGDPKTSWSADSSTNVWVVFDFKADHTLTKIRIYGWKSKEMPADCRLEVSNSFDGPWITLYQFKCSPIGSSNKADPGVPLDFEGFSATARFWKLLILNNHGAHQTSFHGIEFFGYDNRISKLLDQISLNLYEDCLIDNNLNQIEAIVNCTHEQFERLPIRNQNDKKTLLEFISELKAKVSPLKKLEWLSEPLQNCLVGKVLPAFAVKSSSFLTDTLQLICHGGATINGEVFADLEPGGIDEPSVAIFNNISFTKSGKFLLEIRSVANQNMYIAASEPIMVYEVGDPNYVKNTQVTGLPPKVPRLNSFDEESDEDDGGFKTVYDTMEFTNRSKLKIKNWLSKSQDNRLNNGYDDSILDSYSNSIPNSPNVTHMYITNNRGFGSAEHVNRADRLNNSNRKINSANQSNRNGYIEAKSPPLITNGNIMQIVEERVPFSHRTNQGSQTQTSRIPDSEDVIKYREPSRPFVPVSRPIPNTQRVTQTEAPKVLEYEFQELTMEFSEEPYPTLGRNNLKDRMDYLNTAPATEPKSEARVFVNNSFEILSARTALEKKEITENSYYNVLGNVSPRIISVNRTNSDAKDYVVNSFTSVNVGVNLQPSAINNNIFYNNTNSTNKTSELLHVETQNIQTPEINSSIENHLLLSNRSNRSSQISQKVVQNFNNVINSLPKASNGVNQDPIISQAPSLLRKIETSIYKKIKEEPDENVDSNNTETAVVQSSLHPPPPPPLTSIPLAPPLPAPSFFQKYARLNKNKQNGVQNNDDSAPNNANILKETATVVNIHDSLNKNTQNLPHFTKQNTDSIKLVKTLNEAESPNSLKRRVGQTPSPFTIDRIVDDAFDYISDNQLQNANGDANNYGTFTDRARKRLENYQKNKNSISNSSLISSSKHKNDKNP